MGVFNFLNKKNSSSADAAAAKQESAAQRQTLRDLEARAYARWASQGTEEPKYKNISGFERERARRASLEQAKIHLRSSM